MEVNSREENLVAFETRYIVTASAFQVSQWFSQAEYEQATLALITVADPTGFVGYSWNQNLPLNQVHVITAASPLLIRGNSLINSLWICADSAASNPGVAITLFRNALP